MTNWKSGLVTESPQVTTGAYTPGRSGGVTGVVIHHCAGHYSYSLDYLANKQTQASAHYMIDETGTKVAELIEEQHTAWHAANQSVNDRTIGIENANVTLSPSWEVSRKTLDTLIKLLVDIARRHGIKKYTYGVNLWGHKDVSQVGTSCPGPFLYPRLRWLCDKANEQLGSGSKAPSTAPSPSQERNNGGALYRVTSTGLRIRRTPGLNGAVVGSITDGGTYTIVEERDADGYRWGRLKSGAGWIAISGGLAKRL